MWKIIIASLAWLSLCLTVELGRFREQRECNGEYFEKNKFSQKRPCLSLVPRWTGGTSMFGLFVEHGPYVVQKNLTVTERKFPWTYKFSVFYIDNPSYAGKYVPAIGYYIHINNPSAKIKINFKGVAIGDSLCDPEEMLGGYAQFLYQVGLVDEKQRIYVENQADLGQQYFQEKKWEKSL